jgi:hypothetical protein
MQKSPPINVLFAIGGMDMVYGAKDGLLDIQAIVARRRQHRAFRQ